MVTMGKTEELKHQGIWVLNRIAGVSVYWLLVCCGNGSCSSRLDIVDTHDFCQMTCLSAGYSDKEGNGYVIKCKETKVSDFFLLVPRSVSLCLSACALCLWWRMTTEIGGREAHHHQTMQRWTASCITYFTVCPTKMIIRIKISPS